MSEGRFVKKRKPRSLCAAAHENPAVQDGNALRFGLRLRQAEEAAPFLPQAARLEHLDALAALENAALGAYCARFGLETAMLGHDGGSWVVGKLAGMDHNEGKAARKVFLKPQNSNFKSQKSIKLQTSNRRCRRG
jgi:hypothetical protein